MNRVPIPPATGADKSLLTKLAERAARLSVAGNADGLRKTEREIDHLVYKLYDLTPEEIKIVEGLPVRDLTQTGENENAD